MSCSITINKPRRTDWPAGPLGEDVARMELEYSDFDKWAKINNRLFKRGWKVVIEEGSRRSTKRGGAAGGRAWRAPRH